MTKKTVSKPSGFSEIWEYAYDGQNRLASVKRDGTVVAAYAYDPEGRRVKSAEGGSLTVFIYDGIDVIHEESYNASGDPIATLSVNVADLGAPIETVDYVRANGKLVAKIVPGTDPSGRLTATNEVATYYHLDHLGSVRAMTDSLGQPVARMDYEPFGAYLRSTGDEHFGFTGQRNEDTAGSMPNSGIGLYYYGARFYDPVVGRFITQDPAQDGLNWYVYCNNNPLAYVDPDGAKAIYAINDASRAGSFGSDS